MFGRDIDPGLLLLIVVGAFAAHTVFLALARRVNVMSLLGGAYVLLSPVSAASALPAVGLAKYGRVYVTVLLPLVGVLMARAFRLGVASWALLVFAAFYTVSAFWSDAATAALLYKGNWAALVLGGVMIAASIRDRHDFYVTMRTLGVAAGFFAALALSELVVNPGALSRLGRLAIWGMNPNRVGQTASPLLIMVVAILLQDPHRGWRIFATVVAGILAVLILYTGSRGALLSAAIGCFAIASLYVKRPLRLAAAMLLVVGGVYLTQQFARVTAITRFGQYSLELRDEPWDLAMENFREAPLFGVGWVHQESLSGGGLATTTNLHGMYMQVLAETGIAGVLLLVIALAVIGLRGLRLFRMLRPDGAFAVPSHLALGLSASILAHGVVESGPIVGGQVGGLALAFGIGLIDRLPVLARQEREVWLAYAYENGWWGYEDAHFGADAGYPAPAPA